MTQKIVRVEIEGIDEFRKICDSVTKDGKKTIGQMILEAATITHRLAVDSIRSGSRTGKTYFKTKEKIPHVASAPGEQPKTDSGILLQNLTIEKDGSGYTVGSRKGAPHGFWLEFGTSRMKSRPWLVPAFNNMLNAIRGKYG